MGWYGALDMLIVVPVQVGVVYTGPSDYCRADTQIFFSERSVRINGNSKIILAINTVLMYVFPAQCEVSADTISLATASLGVSMTIFSRGQNTFNRTSVGLL